MLEILLSKEFLIVVGVAIFGFVDFMFLHAIDQRTDVPTLHAIAKWFHIGLFIVIIGIICKYDLWC